MTFINLKYKYIFISNLEEISNIIYEYFLSISEDNIYLNLKTFKEINLLLNYNKLDINNFYVFTFIKNPIQIIYNNFLNDIKNNYHLKKNGIIYGNNIQSLYSYINYDHCRNIFNIKDYYYNNDSLPNNMNIFKIENIKETLTKLTNKFNINSNSINNKLDTNIIKLSKINFEINSNLENLIKSKYPIFWSYYNNN
jgi:hypothetical protein